MIAWLPLPPRLPFTLKTVLSPRVLTWFFKSKFCKILFFNFYKFIVCFFLPFFVSLFFKLKKYGNESAIRRVTQWKTRFNEILTRCWWTLVLPSCMHKKSKRNFYFEVSFGFFLFLSFVFASDYEFLLSIFFFVFGFIVSVNSFLIRCSELIWNFLIAISVHFCIFLVSGSLPVFWFHRFHFFFDFYNNFLAPTLLLLF